MSPIFFSGDTNILINHDPINFKFFKFVEYKLDEKYGYLLHEFPWDLEEAFPDVFFLIEQKIGYVTTLEFDYDCRYCEVVMIWWSYESWRS